MKHRKLCLGQFWAENLERIAGYFDGFLVQKWHEQDFFEEFGCFWHKFHQNYLEISRPVCRSRQVCLRQFGKISTQKQLKL